MRALPIVMFAKGLCDFAHLLQGRGAMAGKAFLLRGAVISFDKALLLRMMRLTNQDRYPDGVTEADQGSREIRALRGTHPTRVPIQRDGAGQSVHLKRVRDRLQSSLNNLKKDPVLAAKIDVNQSRVSDQLVSLAASLDSLAQKMQHGPGTIAQLMNDATLHQKLTSSTARADSIVCRASDSRR